MDNALTHEQFYEPIWERTTEPFNPAEWK
jgi:hypothetical protein